MKTKIPFKLFVQRLYTTIIWLVLYAIKFIMAIALIPIFYPFQIVGELLYRKKYKRYVCNFVPLGLQIAVCELE